MADALTDRPLRLADAQAVADLLMAAERVEPVDEAFDEADLIELLTPPGVDLDRGSIAVLDGQRLVAFGIVQFSEPATRWRAYLWGVVDPAYTRRRIGTTVLRHLVRASERMRDDDRPGLPGELRIWVDASRTGTAALVAAEGFDDWRYFFRMRAQLVPGEPDSVRSSTAPAGVRIRTYDPADEDAVRLLSNESFADHWGSSALDPERWRAQYADSVSFRPQHSMVAEMDGRLVGFVHTLEFAAETAARGHPTGFVSRVGTARAVRGRGVASALLAHTLRDLAAHGYLAAELEVDADSPTGAGRLYQRAGFEVVSRARVVGRRI